MTDTEHPENIQWREFKAINKPFIAFQWKPGMEFPGLKEVHDEWNGTFAWLQSPNIHSVEFQVFPGDFICVESDGGNFVVKAHNMEKHFIEIPKETDA